MKLIIIITILLTLSSCVNPYTKYYVDMVGGEDVTQSKYVILPTGEPEIKRGSSDQKNDVTRMKEQGFVLLGYSSFNSAETSDSMLIEQAKKVHATVVVVSTAYTETRKGAVPITTPNNTTTYTNTYGNVYGSGGYASYTGSGYSTTYGTKTTYIPYSVNRYDYNATYWIKGKQRIFGAFLNDVPSELKSEMGTNKGKLVEVVVIGSPAYKADIINGDVLLSIGGVDIYDTQSMNDSFFRYAGEKVNIEIYRNGNVEVKSVLLNNPSN